MSYDFFVKGKERLCQQIEGSMTSGKKQELYNQTV
jgi:hypothetical protein